MRKVMTALAVMAMTMTGLVAVAPAAHAWTAHDYRVSRQFYASVYCYHSVWIDFNWWEESWAGGSHKDYRSFYKNPNGTRQLVNCGNTPINYVLNQWTR